MIRTLAVVTRLELLTLLRTHETYTFGILPALVGPPLIFALSALVISFIGHPTLAVPLDDPPGLAVEEVLEDKWQVLRVEDPQAAFEAGDADLCTKDPGFDTDLYVTSHVRTLTEIWLGHLSLQQGLRDERVRLEGSNEDIRNFRDWFALSLFAAVGREPPGQVVETS